MHRMQAFNRPIPGSAHRADEHLDELIPRLGLGLMQQAQQQSVPAARSADIAQVAGLQGRGLGGELTDLGVGDIHQERSRIEDRIELGEPVGPLTKMLQGWRSRRLLQPREGVRMLTFRMIEQGVEDLALQVTQRRVDACKYGLREQPRKNIR